MGLSFLETMSGEVVDADGRVHHVALDPKAESSSALGFVVDGRARLTGTIRALPWVDGAAVVGTLVARPAADVVGGFMEYDVAFVDADDQRRMVGRGSRVQRQEAFAVRVHVQARFQSAPRAGTQHGHDEA